MTIAGHHVRADPQRRTGPSSVASRPAVAAAEDTALQMRGAHDRTLSGKIDMPGRRMELTRRLGRSRVVTTVITRRQEERLKPNGRLPLDGPRRHDEGQGTFTSRPTCNSVDGLRRDFKTGPDRWERQVTAGATGEVENTQKNPRMRPRRRVTDGDRV